MDMNELNQDYQPQRPFVNPAFLLGIISIFAAFLCCWTVYLPLILGSLAILFSFLSKGNTNQMQPNAKIGLILGSISICIIIALVIFSFVSLYSDPELMKSVQSTYESIYGEPFDMDMFKDL